jgi:hypothetical protein
LDFPLLLDRREVLISAGGVDAEKRPEFKRDKHKEDG